MLPERMNKGHYLLKGNKIARKIIRVKRHPEYTEERVYVLQGDYGIELEPKEISILQEQGYDKYVSYKELNKLFRKGEFLPSNGIAIKGKKIKEK